jgi:putative transposase
VNRLPARSPNLNSYAERWVRSIKEERLSRLTLFGESSLRRAMQQYLVHCHEERNHQGKDNGILIPSRPGARRNKGAVRCRERRGGLLKYNEREAAEGLTGQRALGSQSAHILKIPGMSHRKKTVSGASA